MPNGAAEDERRPLLAVAAPAQSPDNAADPAHRPDRLPWAQLSVICLCRFTEPVCFVMIFPCALRLPTPLTRQVDPSGDPGVRHREIARARRPLRRRYRVGVWLGAVLHSHRCADDLALLAEASAWGRLSDRIGRRPVILIGLLGAAVSTIAFGLSRNLWTLLLSRTLQGAALAGEHR